MFKKLPLIAALLAACAAAPASAQYYDREQECWNPRVGHFERVRPGEYQNDLDYRRCRLTGSYRSDQYFLDSDVYYRSDNRPYRDRYSNDRYARDVPQECWNPRARNFEAVRPGERQDDLDFSRCRVIQDRVYGRSDFVQECWNPRAGHFENVREGSYQNDLDYSQCRIRR